ncbi:hypothetical protein EKK58_11455 [Candidatus Dependentiae bacterium]|nr:MAG: hypothetical protein EKK58_11455 [Candidatus Dependentiae bacterium]
MRIKMRCMSAGPHGIRLVGSIHEVAADEARQLIAGGFAEELPQIAGRLTTEISAKINQLESKIADSWTRDENEAKEEEDKIEVETGTEKKKGKKAK